MIRDTLRDSYKTRFNVRPIKHVLVIGDRSERQLKRAILDCCTMWGGISTLILPVDRSLRMKPLFEALMRTHCPDVAFSYMSVDSSATRRRHDRLKDRLAGIVGYEFATHAADWMPEGIGCHALNVVSDADLATRELSVPRLVTTRVGESLPLLTIFGQIYPGQDDAYAETARLTSRPVGYDDLGFWQMQAAADPFASPINLTSYGFRAQQVEDPAFFSGRIFELVLGDNFDALCLYWNLRATRVAEDFRSERIRRLLLVPSRLARDPESVARLASLIRQIGPEPGVETDAEVLVYGGTEQSVADFELTGGQSGFARHRGSINTRRVFPQGTRDLDSTRSLKWALSHPRIARSFKEGVAAETPGLVSFREGENELRLEPPAQFVNRSQQPVVMDIESDVWGRFPKSYPLATAVHSNGRWTRYGLSLLMSLPAQPFFLHVSVPDELTALGAFFAASGIQVRETVLSGYVDSVARLVGGFGALDVLSDRACYMIVDDLALRSSLKVAQRVIKQLGLQDLSVEEVRDRLGAGGITLDTAGLWKTANEIKSGVLSKVKKDTLPALSALSRAGVLLRGLDLECPACGVSDWHSVGDLAEQVTCRGCHTGFSLPVAQRPGAGEVEWQYKLNTLVNRAWDRDLGVVLVTMNHVAKAADSITCRCAGLELLRKKSPIGDLDWVMWRDGLLVAGECKSGSELSSKDLETARIAIQAGVSRFCFSTVREFTQASKEMVSSLGMELLGRAQIETIDGRSLFGKPLV